MVVTVRGLDPTFKLRTTGRTTDDVEVGHLGFDQQFHVQGATAMARARFDGPTREALLSRVWKDQTFVTVRSVDTLIKRLRKKIEANPADPATSTAITVTVTPAGRERPVGTATASQTATTIRIRIKVPKPRTTGRPMWLLRCCKALCKLSGPRRQRFPDLTSPVIRLEARADPRVSF